MPLTKIQSLGITDGTIVNADINASAAIAGTKLTGVGKVLQVITATDSTQRSTTSTTFVTGSNTLSVSITPSSASNKILILASSGVRCQGDASFYTIFRDATDLGAASNRGMSGTFDGNNNSESSIGINYLDSPSTTSATTYQLYFRSSGVVTSNLNMNNCKGSITVLEIAG
jgi:hypothetical protein